MVLWPVSVEGRFRAESSKLGSSTSCDPGTRLSLCASVSYRALLRVQEDPHHSLSGYSGNMEASPEGLDLSSNSN